MVTKIKKADKKNYIKDYWIKSANNKIHWLRFSLVFFALLDVAAHIYSSPGSTAYVTFWLETEVAFYIIIAVVYLLGLRMWYTPALLYSLLNISIYFVSAFIVIPGITTSPLTGHIQFLSYGLGRLISLIAWLYLIIFGTIALKYDKGSKLDELLIDS